MGARLRGWRMLSWGDRGRLVWMAGFGLPVIHVSLRLSGYVKTRRRVERLSARDPTHAATADELAFARNLTRIAAIAGQRGLIRATCLRQSLLIYWMLRARSLAPTLKLGVRQQSGNMDAHAWVELDGHPLDSSPVHHHAFQRH